MFWIRRTVFGLAQAEFARVAGVGRSVVSRYETGRHNPPYPVLKRIRCAARQRGLPFSGDWFFAVPSPPALDDPGPAHQVAHGIAVEAADGHDAVPAAANPAPAPEIVQ